MSVHTPSFFWCAYVYDLSTRYLLREVDFAE